jgi:endonuclease/exonuclease/phosphatase family metal-dependent hydrolase
MQPTTSAELDLEGAEKVLKLIDMLEDLDDVQNVYPTRIFQSRWPHSSVDFAFVGASLLAMSPRAAR